MVGRTCPTFAPRMSRGALRLRVAEPRSQSRLFNYDAGQIDAAAGFPGSYADTRRPGRQQARNVIIKSVELDGISI